MKSTHLFKRWISIALVLCVLLSFAVPAGAVEESGVSFELVDNDRVSTTLLQPLEHMEMPVSTLAMDEEKIVRVSIVLEDAATIDMGYELSDLADSEEVVSYRQKLVKIQEKVTADIESRIGCRLDVKWNLTLAANVISANVEYGQIDIIASVDGVKKVLLEQQYSPISTVGGENAEPNMVIATTSEMTGSVDAWEAGYTGAGSRIAIIDTGIDIDHQSFSAEAYIYALEQSAKAKNITLDEYKKQLDLLDADEIKETIPVLNVLGKDSSVTGEKLFMNEKVAFAFNYVDNTYDYVTHERDRQSDHGSHVAGIAAANRYIEQNEQMVDAIEAVKVVGNAPDAQLIIMKVFGIGGGAYDSDYMAAIEDAVMLGADSINLSLGSVNNGYSNAGELYERVMENLEKSGAIVTMAAGNEGSWPTYANNSRHLPDGKGLNYAEDVMYSRMGTPASYTNSMAVASVDNNGQISNAYLSFGEGDSAVIVGYSETVYNNMKLMTSLDTLEEGNGEGTEYEFIMIEGLGSKADFESIDVSGKIAFIPRGELAFYEKATNAVKAGAIATVIVNNVAGTIGMDMTSYYDDEPAVAITKADGEKIQAMATKQTAGGKTYYTGKMRIHSSPTVQEGENDYLTMSYFSSWGTTGDLALKPEITAPGGNIYSVKGDTASTDTYKVNSGTSMAAPQVAGIAAIARQYIREQKLTEAFGHSARQIVQSLLMSTSVPLKDGDGNYYSLLQQGSGMASSRAVINADTYIMMKEDATLSYADGKVKAELGDDPKKEGVYEFSFTIYNPNETDRSFTLSADAFTQAILNAESAPDSGFKVDYLLESTKPLDSYALFMKDGVTLNDSTVTVSAKSSTEVKARIVVTKAGKAWLDEHCPNGTYIQAFVYAEAQGNYEGALASTHSIPMLAFYGNWTDPYMYDSGNYSKGELVSAYSTPNTTDKSRVPYMEVFGWDVMGWDRMNYGTNYIAIDTEYSDSAYAFGGNPLVNDTVYMPERNAINGTIHVEYWNYVPMRDASYRSYEIKNVDTGERYLYMEQAAQELGIWYSGSSQAWQSGQQKWHVNQTLPEMPEGNTVEFTMTRLPEYYDEGKLGENSAPGEGAKLSIRAIVDSTSPVVNEIEYDSINGIFDVTAKDENYVAAVVLYSGSGDKVIAYTGSKAEITKGEEAVYRMDTDGLAQGGYLLQVFDYALNTTTYYMEIDGEEIIYTGAMLAFNLEDNKWVKVDKNSDEIPAVTDETRIYTAAAAVDEKIYAIAYGTELYCLNVADPEKSTVVGDTGLTLVDLCYNAADGNLYGVSDENKLVCVNTETGKGSLVGTLPLETNTIACDENGVFYSNLYGSGKIYSYTIDALKKGDAAYDFDGDGAVNEADGQALLDYLTGKTATVQNIGNADIDEDGEVDTYDVYLLFDKLPRRINLVADTGIASKYMQAMEVDPNNGTLYWASYSTELIGTNEVGFSYIFEIDTDSGKFTRYADLWDQLSCLIVLDKDAGSMYGPEDGVDLFREAEVALADGQGSVNAIASVAETAAVASNAGVDNSLRNIASDEVAKTVEIELTAQGRATNGLYVVTFDPTVMSLVSVVSGAELASYAESSGRITFGYADKTAAYAGDVIATLSFETANCEAEAAVIHREENNNRPESSSTVDTGAHEWGAWREITPATCVAGGEEQRECENCDAVEKRTIPGDETLHGWGEWTQIVAPARNEPGTEERTCRHCDTVETRWVLSEKMMATEQDTYFGQIDIYENSVDYGKVTGVGVTNVKRLSTTDTSMRYLVELSSDTPADDVFDVYLKPTPATGAGVGWAIKRELVESVGWDDDDTDYVIALKNGVGKLTAYSYMNSTQYVLIEIYFVVGDADAISGDVTYIELPEMSDTSAISNNSGRIVKIGVWKESVNKSYWEVSEDETEIEGYIWLDTQTVDDAAVALELVADGRCRSITSGGEDVSKSGVVAKLVSGKATVTVELTTYSGVVRRYTIHLRNHQNVAPVLAGAASGSARAQRGVAYNIDLGTLFNDANGDAISYTVSIDGAAPVEAAEQYSITPSAAGELVLVFTASDGFMVGEQTYTLTLNVSETGYTAGDVNDDGKVNNKDVTILERYLAGWEGVTINEAAADTLGDGKVNNKDVTILERYLAGWTGVTLG